MLGQTSGPEREIAFGFDRVVAALYGVAGMILLAAGSITDYIGQSGTDCSGTFYSGGAIDYSCYPTGNTGEAGAGLVLIGFILLVYAWYRASEARKTFNLRGGFPPSTGIPTPLPPAPPSQPPPASVCRVCGTQCLRGSTFCSRCGARLG